MTTTPRDLEVTKRLIDWINVQFPSRGRFSLMEGRSGIPAQRWKNVYYRRQAATQQMLDFVKTTDAAAGEYVLTGIARPAIATYPFRIKPPSDQDVATMAGRLLWAAMEWAAPQGAGMFEFLACCSNFTISRNEWANLMLDSEAEPTAAMLSLVCSARPHLASWIMCGSATAQVDPRDGMSVQQWAKLQNARIDEALQGH